MTSFDDQGICFWSRAKWAETARKTQVGPIGDWSIWLILAGRGWGKTRTGAENIITYAMKNQMSFVVLSRHRRFEESLF